jgi:polygalacturonase
MTLCDVIHNIFLNGILMKLSFLLPLSIFSLLLPTLSSAADTRHVIEPNYPATCSVVYARNNLITADIQSALNKCGSGKAVQLSSNGSMNTFLSGALNMPSGVSLLIDKGVTLKAINNASAFDNGKKHVEQLMVMVKGVMH